jgi:signal transduction histidine kinase/DNA-binding response OmpR family regulator
VEDAGADLSATRGAPITGRADELRRLRFAIDDPDCRLVVLRGPAGAGKTALAEAALARARTEGALTGSGKYAEGDAQSPYEPILQALSEAVGQGLDQLYEPAPVLAGLVEALGPAAEVLRRAGFRGLAGAPSLTIAATGRREGAALLTDAVLQLARWLEGFNLPIALLIDDWRRNAPESRSLLQSLAEECAGLTLLLTERDDQSPHALAALAGARALEVGGLRPADRRALFVSLLAEAGPAAFDFFGADGPALPFDIQAAAQALTQAEALERVDGRWRVDPIRGAAALPGGQAQGAGQRAPGLTPTARRLALALAVWGDAAPALGLRLALGMAPATFQTAVTRLGSLGMARRRSDQIQFAHDRLREAVLSDAGPAAADLAAELADRLAGAAGPDWAEMSYAALHLRQSGGLQTADPTIWRDRFAEGARDARARLDTASAASFAESAWSLSLRAPAQDHAAARLILREATLAAADRRAPAETLVRAQALVGMSISDSERGEDYELAIGALRASGDPEMAWSFACGALAHYGLRPPDKVGLPALLMASWAWRRARRRAGASAADAAEEIEGVTRTAHAAGVLAFERNPALAVYIICRSSALIRRHPRAAAFWNSVDAFLAAVFGDFAGAARLGRDAIAGVREDGVYRASTLYRAYYFGQIWDRPMAELRAQCAEVQELALLEGDLATATVATRNKALIAWRTHPSLSELKAELGDILREAGRLGDADMIEDISAFVRVVEALADPRREVLAELARDAESTVLGGSPILMLELASLNSDWIAAAALARRVAPRRRGFDSHPGGVVWRFHETLARLKTGARARPADLAFVRKAAALNPADHRAKLLVLEAEQLRARGRTAASVEAYRAAVHAALTASSRIEAGLACECAADAARAAGRPDLAEAYEDHAQQVWARWGAAAKLAPPSLQAELEAVQSQALAAERDGRAKSRFLVDVAHELRTPLQGMQGLIDLAAADPATLDLATFREIFGGLRSVVDDLTDFGALASGEARMTLAPASVADLVRSEVRLAASTTGEGSGQVELSLADDLPDLVLTDEGRARQVVRNLLSNAVKYGQGGRISVTVRRPAPATSQPDEIAIVVEDHGPGLNEAALRRIFEPFERGAHAGDGRGLGLGLTVSRRLAEQLGGSLRAENREEGGARFTFHLAAPPFHLAAPPAEAENAPEGPKAGPLRILLAEDVPLVRQVIAANLRRDGHDVYEASDGGAAWRMWQAGAFDLAVIDWSMPRLGGRAVLDRMRAAGAAPAVIVLTASSDPVIAADAEAAGAARVLRKPISAQELARAVAAVCGGVASTDPSEARYQQDMAGLGRAARLELEQRARAVLALWRSGAAVDPREVHRLAGLAAQFGWAAVAEAADALEAGLTADREAAGRAIEDLERALAELADGA